MTATTTIRVPVRLRDSLTSLARQRRTSVPKLLEAFALEAALAAERAASLRDYENPEAAAEYELWDNTAGDGID